MGLTEKRLAWPWRVLAWACVAQLLIFRPSLRSCLDFFWPGDFSESRTPTPVPVPQDRKARQNRRPYPRAVPKNRRPYRRSCIPAVAQAVPAFLPADCPSWRVFLAAVSFVGSTFACRANFVAGFSCTKACVATFSCTGAPTERNFLPPWRGLLSFKSFVSNNLPWLSGGLTIGLAGCRAQKLRPYGLFV